MGKNHERAGRCSEVAVEETMRKSSLVIAFCIFMNAFFVSVTILPEGVIAPTICGGPKHSKGDWVLCEGLDR